MFVGFRHRQPEGCCLCFGCPGFGRRQVKLICHVLDSFSDGFCLRTMALKGSVMRIRAYGMVFVSNVLGLRTVSYH